MALWSPPQLISGTGSAENPLTAGGTFACPFFGGDGNLKRASNQLQCASPGYCDGYLTYDVGLDAMVQVTVSTVPIADGDELYLALRLSEEGTTTPTYYQFRWNNMDKTHYLVDKIVGGVETSISGSQTISVANGDVIAFTVTGDTLAVWKNGIALNLWTDTSITTGKKIGFGLKNTTTCVSSFNGFAIPTPPHATALEYLRDTGDGTDSNPIATPWHYPYLNPQDVGSAMQRVSNQFASSVDGYGNCYWTPGMGPIDGALATIDIATLDTGHFKPVWIDFGLNNLNSGSLTGYGVAFNDDVSGSNNNMFRYYYYADDDDHMIGDLTSVNLVSGDAIGVTAFNTPGDGWNYIVGWYRHNGVWRAISMRHDNRYTDGGSYGIGCTGSTVRLTYFRATVPPYEP